MAHPFFSFRRYLRRLLERRTRGFLDPACAGASVPECKRRPWLEQLEDRLAPTANTVDWADWTASVSGIPGSAQATITVPGVSPITVSYAGEVTFADTDATAGPQYWVPTAPYVSQNVGAAPSLPDIVALTGGNTTVDTVTFSQPVLNPILAINSLGNNGLTATYDFNAPFTILSSGPGFFGGPGTLTQLPGNVLSGVEGNGAIQFQGRFTSIQWTDPISEYWSGFTVGLPEAANTYYPPTANDDHYNVTKNTALMAGSGMTPGVLANDTATAGFVLTAALVSGPSHGTLNLNPDGSFLYTPAAQYLGSDSFTYKFNDGTMDSNVATVNLAVGLPTSLALSASQTAVAYGTSVTFTATVINPSGTPTGAVEFFDDTTGTDLGPGTIMSSGPGTTTWIYATQPRQLQQTNSMPDMIRAAFTGTNNFFNSSGNLVGGETVIRQNLSVAGVTANNKVYDGSNTASFNISLATLAGMVPGDIVSLSEVDGFFANPNVGNAIPVTTMTPILTGPNAHDYAPFLNQPPLTANITPAPLTITGLTANDKNYGSSRLLVGKNFL